MQILEEWVKIQIKVFLKMLTLNLKGNPKGDWVTLRLFDPLKEVTRSLLITKSLKNSLKNHC